MQGLPRIYSIQALRAVAAILVVIYHARASAYIYQERYGIGQTVLFDFAFLRELGAIGVDIFFVISGFVMTYITWREPREAASVWPFLRRRLIRIVPSYWLYTLIMAGILVVMAGKVMQTVDLRAILWSLSFIPYTPTGNNMAPVLAVGWTLSYEMYFYLLIALGILLPFRVFLAGLGVYFAACTLMPLFYRSGSPVIGLVTNSLVLEFYFGMLICAGFMVCGKVSRWLGWGGLMLGLAILAFLAGDEPPTAMRGLIWGIPAAGIALWFLSRESAGNILAKPVFQALGASSYSLYLTHLMLLPLFGRLAAATGLLRHIPLDLYIVVAVLTCIAAGHVLYLLVEVPLSRLAGRLLSRRAARTAPT